MEPDTQPRQPPGAYDGILRCIASHHKARRSQYPLEMGGLDGLIYGECRTKIIRCDDDPSLHAVINGVVSAV